MTFIWNQAGLRLFYLGVGPLPRPTATISKAGRPFAPPTNALAFVANGWWSCQVTPADTDTLGPLAWYIASGNLISQPQDLVTPLPHGTINPAALQAAFEDLTKGFAPNTGLNELLRRPLFQFLLSLE